MLHQVASILRCYSRDYRPKRLYETRCRLIGSLRLQRGRGFRIVRPPKFVPRVQELLSLFLRWSSGTSESSRQGTDDLAILLFRKCAAGLRGEVSLRRYRKERSGQQSLIGRLADDDHGVGDRVCRAEEIAAWASKTTAIGCVWGSAIS